jgi:transcription elongation factor GreA
MAMQEKPMTPEGFRSLQAELKRLKEHDRLEIIKAIALARSYGDLSENAEYHAAKEQQRSIERRIYNLEQSIATAKIIDPKQFLGKKTIVFGAQVTIKDMDSQQNKTYQIVGSDESNPLAGLISLDSLLAKALIGKEEGDFVEYALPESTQEKIYEILAVSYA